MKTEKQISSSFDGSWPKLCAAAADITVGYAADPVSLTRTSSYLAAHRKCLTWCLTSLGMFHSRDGF